MTYTLVARCPKSGAFGIGIATYSLAVGAKCPAIATGVGALTTQAFVNQTFKALGLRLLSQGHPAAQVLDLLRGSDPDFEFRQVAIIDRRGDAVCHTGTRTRPWSGHHIGDGFVALGNVLKGEAVVAAMADAYRASETHEFAERIMRALEAGRAAGGQHGLDGPLPERSAGLLVHEGEEHALLDLRVDSHPDAVNELRRVLDEFKPYVPFYRQRWREPANALPQDAFVNTLATKPTARD
jgi:uncharacterized Ntn-hydrolase superfamily protein